MSTSEMERLTRDAQENGALRDALKALTGDSSAWIAEAREQGYDVSAEDIKTPTGELSEDDLEKVAGGLSENLEGLVPNLLGGKPGS